MVDVSPQLSFGSHTRFGCCYRLAPDEISAFAQAIGDANPLHHDREHARSSRFGGIIASGPHTSSLMMGTVASYFSSDSEMVGVAFEFFFRAAVPANQSFEVEWLVIDVRATRGSQKHLVELRGRLKLADGRSAVGAKGCVLVGPEL